MVDVLTAVKAAVDDFAGDEEQFDDQTMVGFRYNGLSGNNQKESE